MRIARADQAHLAGFHAVLDALDIQGGDAFGDAPDLAMLVRADRLMRGARLLHRLMHLQPDIARRQQAGQERLLGVTFLPALYGPWLEHSRCQRL